MRVNGYKKEPTSCVEKASEWGGVNLDERVDSHLKEDCYGKYKLEVSHCIEKLMLSNL